MNTMLRIIFAGFMLSGILFTAHSARACDFTFPVNDESKTEYSVGEVLIVTVTLNLTHRVCPDPLDTTRFDFHGIKVLGATKWAQVKAGVFERKFKVQFISESENGYSMRAVRICDKDGGKGSIEFKVS
jgi:hypothetical protein